MRVLPTLCVALMATLTAGFVVGPPGARPYFRLVSTSSSTTLQMTKKRRNERTSFGIGKDWEARWEKMYHQLLAERSWNHGESKNLEYSENPKLWLWLNIQKENLRRNVMRQDRKEKLAAMGYSTTVALSPTILNSTEFSATTTGIISYQDFFPPTPPGSPQQPGGELPFLPLEQSFWSGQGKCP